VPAAGLKVQMHAEMTEDGIGEIAVEVACDALAIGAARIQKFGVAAK
jgi:hypothetical protein